MSRGRGDDDLPRVPDDSLQGWERTEERSETLFKVTLAEVVGHTAIYEDSDLRSTVRQLSGGAVDRMWRFFFATRLTFSPLLPPTVGTAAVQPTVEAQANATFSNILHERGFQDVERTGRERITVETGDRATVQSYEATLPTSVIDLDVAGELAVWSRNGEFRLAGGAYPELSVEEYLGFEVPGLDIDPAEFERELRELVRSVR